MNGLAREVCPEHAPENEAIPIVYCDDVRMCGEYAALRQTGILSFIWAPLYVNEKYWGLLSVEECAATREWSESDRQLVSAVSSAVAGAIARDLIDKERGAMLERSIQASRSKSDFLANMSHEMRTPLNAVIGMTAIGKSAPDLEKKNYAFRKIENASTHLLGVINDVLDMSKIEANKLELSYGSFDFEKMLRKIANIVNFRVEEQRQNFYVYLDSRIPRNLFGDDQRLSQVVMNLLSNAVKFTPERGTIRLRARLLGKEEDPPGAGRHGVCVLRIEVSDSGIGISPEQQTSLFKSFGIYAHRHRLRGKWGSSRGDV